MLQDILKEKKMTMYRLAKLSGVPYATVNDICNDRVRLEKCSAETIYKLAKVLDISMEELLEPCFCERAGFENFKSSVCHRLKEQGDYEFIIETLNSQEIETFYKRKWYPECLYLLAMLDYVSRENDIPLCEDYDEIRQCKLERPVYPAGIRALCAATRSDEAKKQAYETAIPEFKRFNIIENEVRNVV